MRNKIWLSSVIAVSGIAFAASNVAAQDAIKSAGLEEVIVTARKTSENLQRVPAAVTAITAADLAQRPITTPQDLGALVPGLYTGGSVRSATSLNFAMRGQAAADVILTTDSSIGVYVDGVYVPRTYGLKMALMDLDRIEVLKGPQGTLYGKNTTGGAIGIFTKRPDLSALGGSGSFEYGKYGTAIVNAVVNAPVIQDKLAVRAAGNFSHTDGYAKSFAGTPLTKHDDFALRTNVALEASPTLDLLLTGGYAESNGAHVPLRVSQLVLGASGALEAGLQLGAPQATAVQTGNAYLTSLYQQQGRFTYGIEGGPDHFHSWNTGLTATWQPSDSLSIKSITGFQQFARSSYIDFDSSPRIIAQSKTNTRDHTISQELQLNATLRPDLHVLAGAYYSDEEGLEVAHTIALPTLQSNADSTYDADVSNRTFGVYGQGSYDVTDRLSITGGIRYSKDFRDTTDRARVIRPTGTTCSVPAFQLNNPAICATTPATLSFGKVSYSITASYAFDPDLNAYVTHRTGYRAGGWNVFTAGALTSYAPESVKDVEAGLKSEFLERRVRTNLALYYSKYTNIQKATQRFLPNGTNVRAIDNAASATIQGGEVEISAAPTPSLNLDFTANYTKAKYDSFRVVNQNTGALISDRTGEPFSYPKWTYSIGGQKTWDLPVGELLVRADWTWTGKVIFYPPTQSGFAQTIQQDGYGLLAARIELTLRNPEVTLALVGRNLLDKDYATGATDVRSIAWAFLIPGEPRYFGIQIKKKFGAGS